MAMKTISNQHHMNDVVNDCSSDEQRIVLFESKDGQVELSVNVEEETIWLTQAQMAELFDRSIAVISRHINNVFAENELVKEGNLHFMQIASSARPVAIYSLDVIISVGYRVKSQRGVEFRRWATDVLRRYILKGHVENEGRLRQLGEVVRIIERIPGELASREILDIVESYTEAYELLDAYDRALLARSRPETMMFTAMDGLTKQAYQRYVDQARTAGAGVAFATLESQPEALSDSTAAQVRDIPAKVHAIGCSIVALDAADPARRETG